MTLALFACFAALFFVAERLSPIHLDQRIVRTGFATDVLYVGIHYFLRVFVNWKVAGALSDLSTDVLPSQFTNLVEDQPTWIQVVVVLLVLDFMFYVMHRLKHRWRWWWRLHETHHSSKELDWFASVRFHPLEKLLDRLIFLLPLTFLGPSDQALLIWSAVDVFFGMFGHSNVTWRIGPLIFLFIGPEMHRWHHALDPQHRDCNFGNNFSVFDWLFGTAYVANELPAAYGVDDAGYPQTNILKQCIYAFRPLSGELVTSGSDETPQGLVAR